MNNLTPDEFCTKLYDFKIPGKLDFVGLVPSIATFYIPGPYMDGMVAVIDSAEALYGERIKFYGIDVNEHPSIAKEFGIRAIPTTLFVPVGPPAAVISGMGMSLDEIEKLIMRFMPLPTIQGVNDGGLKPGQKLILAT